jgi:hypothetical protein
METNHNWSLSFDDEIGHARRARQAGNEGRARVCARRAAGVVIGEFFRRHNLPDPSESAYDRLLALGRLQQISPEVKAVTKHLVERVTPEHRLPYEADLIADAIWLRDKLLQE